MERLLQLQLLQGVQLLQEHAERASWFASVTQCQLCAATCLPWLQPSEGLGLWPRLPVQVSAVETQGGLVVVAAAVAAAAAVVAVHMVSAGGRSPCPDGVMTVELSHVHMGSVDQESMVFHRAWTVVGEGVVVVGDVGTGNVVGSHFSEGKAAAVVVVACMVIVGGSCPGLPSVAEPRDHSRAVVAYMEKRLALSLGLSRVAAVLEHSMAVVACMVIVGGSCPGLPSFAAAGGVVVVAAPAGQGSMRGICTCPGRSWVVGPLALRLLSLVAGVR